MNSFGIKSCLTDDFSSINQTRKPNVYNKSQSKKHAVYTQTGKFFCLGKATNNQSQFFSIVTFTGAYSLTLVFNANQILSLECCNAVIDLTFWSRKIYSFCYYIHLILVFTEFLSNKQSMQLTYSMF